MNPLNRRRFLLLVGIGVAAAAGGGVVLTVRQLAKTGQGSTVKFQAVTGLPRKPFPNYASYVIDGQVDLSSRTGTITKSVFAGPPEERRPIALLSRIVRVTDVQDQGGSQRITGEVEDRSLLQKGEGSTFTMLVDSSHRIAQTDFFGSPIQLQVESWEVS